MNETKTETTGTLHLFAPGASAPGHLLEFYKLPNPAPWQVYDHTPEMGGAAITGTPAVYADPAGSPATPDRSPCSGLSIWAGDGKSRPESGNAKPTALHPTSGENALTWANVQASGSSGMYWT